MYDFCSCVTAIEGVGVEVREALHVCVRFDAN
jgi:hypothetical protein